MGNFGVALIRDELRAQLVPGEVALAFENASMRSSADRSGKTGKPKLVDGFNAPTLGNILTHDTGFRAEDGYFDAKISGVGVEGAVGSRAQQVASALSELGALLLTTQRLAVVDVPSSRILHSIPIGELHSVTRAPRFLQIGRLEIAFRDGSVVRPTLAILIPRASARFLRAVETGQPQS